MSCVDNISPNTQDRYSTDEGEIFINYIKTVSTDSSRGSNSKKREIELSQTVFHKDLSNEELDDIDGVKIIKESDRDYKSVTDVISRDCGEPLKSQFLRMDFNPIEGVDDDHFNENKCVAFWKFIDDHPELNSLKVKPEVKSSVDITDSYITVTDIASSTRTESNEGIQLTPLTVMALNWLKNEEVMTDALATKAASQPCEPISKDEKYLQKNKTDEWPSGTKINELKLHRAPFSASRTGCRSHAHLPSKGKHLDDLAQMMAEMHKWDLEHPKSMGPPTNQSSLTIEHSDRKRSILPYIDTNDDKYCEKCLN